ncbi:hypothetical protein HQ563_06745 [bacterium]|nr:hypothetical protein [bacterium]
MNQKNQAEEQRSSCSGLYVILMVNAMIWAIAIIASLIVLHDTGYFRRLFPIFAGGACVASVAVSIAWRKKDFS